MIPDHANPAKLPAPIGPPELLAEPRRSCALHDDCDVADVQAWMSGRCGEYHCAPAEDI